MKVVIQRVSEASVTIDNIKRATIKNGLLILVGFEHLDQAEDIEWTAAKIVNLRIFNDSQGIMNLSVLDVDAEILIVSQFTLHASYKKGNRPSYILAAKPEIAIPLYNSFIQKINSLTDKTAKTGEFGADMKVALINDGPVTILMDSKNKI